MKPCPKCKSKSVEKIGENDYHCAVCGEMYQDETAGAYTAREMTTYVLQKAEIAIAVPLWALLAWPGIAWIAQACNLPAPGYIGTFGLVALIFAARRKGE